MTEKKRKQKQKQKQKQSQVNKQVVHVHLGSRKGKARKSAPPAPAPPAGAPVLPQIRYIMPAQQVPASINLNIPFQNPYGLMGMPQLNSVPQIPEVPRKESGPIASSLPDMSPPVEPVPVEIPVEPPLQNKDATEGRPSGWESRLRPREESREEQVRKTVEGIKNKNEINSTFDLGLSKSQLKKITRESLIQLAVVSQITGENNSD
jgi:hypothetical protein